MTKRKHKPKLNRRIHGILGDNANLYVKARNSITGKVLIGGLGNLGVGEKWFPEEPIHASYPGYRTAREDRS